MTPPHPAPTFSVSGGKRGVRPAREGGRCREPPKRGRHRGFAPEESAAGFGHGAAPPAPRRARGRGRGRGCRGRREGPWRPAAVWSPPGRRVRRTDALHRQPPYLALGEARRVPPSAPGPRRRPASLLWGRRRLSRYREQRVNTGGARRREGPLPPGCRRAGRAARCGGAGRGGAFCYRKGNKSEILHGRKGDTCGQCQ